MSCTGKCNQGRICTCKTYTSNTDGSDPGLPVVMFEKPWQWLQDLMLHAVYAIGLIASIVLLAGFAGYFWGRYFFPLAS